ncbi:MAG: phospho-N-acetylmuramoyl-pentapeptide-transferase [Abditibacteriaceae bacterium]
MHNLAQLTLGSVIGLIMALVLMLMLGNPLINWLREKSWRKGTPNWEVREDTPDSHQAKQGTPSMGGLGMALCIGLTLLSAVFLQLAIIIKSWHYGIGVTVVTLGLFLLTLLPLPLLYFGNTVLGFLDDWSKASGRGGLRALAKFGIQIILAILFVGFALWLANSPGLHMYNSDVYQHFATATLANWWLSIPVIIIAIVAMGNAVNLTDGLDGLATGLALQSLFAIALLSDPWTIQYLFLAATGVCLGFLFFNRHPAKIFMGDTGSLALGALIGGGAVLLGGIFLLPFVAFIFIVEMLSVIVQVLWFKYTRCKTGTGQRILKRAPLHHHFELCGWSEWRVVGTFWGINLVTTLIGLWLWNSGLLPHWPI